MGLITQQTATDIALAYREVEVGEKLLADVRAAADRFSGLDIRDAFGRRQDGLQLGVPSGEMSRSCFHVPWQMAGPIIETHIAAQRARIALLTEQAVAEAGAALVQRA